MDNGTIKMCAWKSKRVHNLRLAIIKNIKITMLEYIFIISPDHVLVMFLGGANWCLRAFSTFCAFRAGRVCAY